MKIKNKKGVGIAINTIIVATLAVLVLIVGIFLIRRSTEIVYDQIPKIIELSDAMWKPTSEDPFRLHPYDVEIKQGKEEITTLQIYNNADDDILCNLAFIPVEDKGSDKIKFLYAVSNRDIPVHMVGEWKIHVEALKTAEPDHYLYVLNIDCGEFINQQDLFIEVKKR